jgi:receptor protein-tyrosine kinase
MLQRLEKEQELSAPASGPVAVPAAVLSGIPEERLERLGAEEVTRLVQRVFRSPGVDAARVVVFSGVDHGDGCSWICASSAFTLAAQTQSSICVVDANLRTPSLHRYFDVANRFGLAEAMEHPGPIRSFAQQASSSNLWVLTSGSPTVQSSLSSERLHTRLAELRTEFDYVLIDTAPANLYADAVTLGRSADGIVLVLQSNATRREAALKVKESFETAKVRLLGAVLNRRTFPIPQAIYDRL